MAKIVIADDYEAMRFVIKEVLIGAGHEVAAVAGNGVDALHCYLEHKPDVMVMSQQLPVLKGVEVARSIREKHPEARLILCTSDFAEVRPWAGPLRFEVVPKPFHPGQLLAAVERALGGK